MAYNLVCLGDTEDRLSRDAAQILPGRKLREVVLLFFVSRNFHDSKKCHLPSTVKLRFAPLKPIFFTIKVGFTGAYFIMLFCLLKTD